MMPKHLFCDDRLHRLRLSSLSISNFIWDTLGWQKFAAWIDTESAPYVVPEQVAASRGAETVDKRKLDQYMLGQLAIEILDGRLWFAADELQDIDEGKKSLFCESAEQRRALEGLPPATCTDHFQDDGQGSGRTMGRHGGHRRATAHG